jgi:hypothetical protein
MGEIGVKILVEKCKGEAPPMVNHIILQDKIIIRKSCGFNRTGYIR